MYFKSERIDLISTHACKMCVLFFFQFSKEAKVVGDLGDTLVRATFANKQVGNNLMHSFLLLDLELIQV